MKVSIQTRFWFWKQFTWRPFKDKITCTFKGHDWIDFVSIAGGYNRSRRCRRCWKRQVMNGWIND